MCVQIQPAKVVNWILRKALRTHPLDANPFEKTFAMLTAYMDDSGSHATSHNCVIAGYWGEVGEWRRFERQWRGVLLKYGIEEFKANQFWPRLSGGRRNPPYNGWSDTKADSFIDELLRVIEARRVFPFASGILGEEWNQLPPHYRGALTFGCVDDDIQKALFVPLTLAILRVLGHCRVGRTVNFAFDDDPKNVRLKQAIVGCFSEIKGNLLRDGSPDYDKIGDFSFVDSKPAAPIQAADLLAYEAHRYAKNALGDPHSPARTSYTRALGRYKTIEDFQLVDAARIAPLKIKLAEIDRQFLEYMRAQGESV